MRFLSPAWLTAADEALASSPEVAAAVRDTSLRLLQVVTGGPEGDVAYLVALEGGRARVLAADPGSADPHVTLSSDWATAVAIATGELAAVDAFTTGRLRVGGDVDRLRAQAPALAGLHAAFAGVRAATTY